MLQQQWQVKVFGFVVGRIVDEASAHSHVVSEWVKHKYKEAEVGARELGVSADQSEKFKWPIVYE